VKGGTASHLLRALSVKCGGILAKFMMIIILLILVLIINIILLYKINVILNSNKFIITILKNIGDSVIYSLNIHIKSIQSKNEIIFEDEIEKYISELTNAYIKNLYPSIQPAEYEILVAYIDYKVRHDILPNISTKIRLT